MSIFYCPNCNKLEENFNGKLNKIIWANCRDGYGRGIYHIVCPECEYMLSGYMNFDSKDDIEYVKSVISIYSENANRIIDKLNNIESEHFQD